MKLRKILCLFLSLCVVLGALVVPSAYADAAASYFVRGEVRGGTLVAHVYLRGATAYGGRLALAYDKNLMELADTTSVYDAVSGVGDVAISPEGHAASVLLGDGHALFAWYVDSGDPIEAKSNEVEIATIAFLLKDGVSEADFSRNTLGMYYVNETMVYGWTCSAEIIGVENNLLVAYRNTSVKDEYLCDVDFDYPNCEYIPPVTYDVAINVKNTDGKALVSAVKLDTVDAETDIYGDTTIPMLAGTYFYRVTSPGYEVKTGYFIVDDSGEKLNVVLRSYGQIAYDTVNALEIGFSEGDSEAAVYGDLILPTDTDYGTVTWTSDSSAVNEYGGVRHCESDELVTLTASVTVDLTLPEAGENGSTILWQSDNEAVVSSNGRVTTPEYDTEVTLTAYVMRGTAVDTKQFTILVKGEKSTTPDAEAVQNVINALEIGYSAGDSADSVKQNLTLPTVGTGDTVITWTSSLPAVITPYGGAAAPSATTAPEATATPTATTEPASTTAPSDTDTQGNEAGSKDKQRFIDIGDVTWAQNAINTLADEGVISGTSENTYSPHNNIRRADFVMLLVKLYKLDTEITDTFEDVTEDKYYYSDVSKAKSLGIISGIDETHFNPESSISRQDMMTMTYRALLKLGKLEETEETDIDAFKDYASISDYALEGVKYLVSSGAVHGDTDGSLNPKANTTRAETAVFLYGLAR